jgi:hypothetical protein
MESPRIIEEEHLELIAQRATDLGGDRWRLVEGDTMTVHPTLTDALEAWFQMKGEPVSFRLDPLDSKLYAIRTEEVEVKPEPTRTFSIYGEYSQINEQ